MAIKVMMPIGRRAYIGLHGGNENPRSNVMPRPGVGASYFMSGGWYHNALAPSNIAAIDFIIPTVGLDVHSWTDLHPTYPSQDPRDNRLWTDRTRTRKSYDWAQAYVTPANVPTYLRSETFVVLSVPSEADMYRFTFDGGATCNFRVGTVVFEGNYTDATTYWGT